MTEAERLEADGSLGSVLEVKAEKVHHPPHYGGDKTYETIKVIAAWGLNFALGNAAKYISRAGKKPGVSPIEDLEKAKWYIQYEIDRLKEDLRK